MTMAGQIKALAAAGILALLSGCVAVGGGGHWRPHGEVNRFHDDRPRWGDSGRRHRGDEGHALRGHRDHGPSHHRGRRR